MQWSAQLFSGPGDSTVDAPLLELLDDSVAVEGSRVLHVRNVGPGLGLLSNERNARAHAQSQNTAFAVCAREIGGLRTTAIHPAAGIPSATVERWLNCALFRLASLSSPTAVRWVTIGASSEGSLSAGGFAHWEARWMKSF